MATTPEKVSFRERIRQIGVAFTMTHERDKLLVPLLLAAFVVPVLIAVVVGLITHLWLSTMPLGIMLGIVLTMVLFLRRVMKAQYAQLEGQVGAPAGIVQGMRGN